MVTAVERFERLEKREAKKAVLPWTSWPHAQRVFLILRYAGRHLFPSWRPLQDSWELLLVGNYDGKRGANGKITRQGIIADEVYAQAVTDAEEWQASGSKTAFL